MDIIFFFIIIISFRTRAAGEQEDASACLAAPKSGVNEAPQFGLSIDHLCSRDRGYTSWIYQLPEPLVNMSENTGPFGVAFTFLTHTPLAHDSSESLFTRWHKLMQDAHT